MNVQEYKELYQYVAHKKYDDNVSENKKRAIRKKAHDVIFQNNELFKILPKTDEFDQQQKRLIISEDRKDIILQECHVDLGNHLGRDRTLSIVKAQYYWTGMYKDVNNFIKKCHNCQLNNKKTVTTVPEMIPVVVPPRPFQKVAIDLIGPFMDPKNTSEPLSSKGYKYVLNCMDYYTKYPESFCLFNKTAPEVAEKIHELKCRYSMITEIISDQGGEFNNALMTELLKTCGMKKINTSAYHPQANGMIERFNQTMKGMINKALKDGDGSNWHNYVSSVCFSYRITKHTSTKYSPFFLLFNQHPMLNASDVQTHEDLEYSQEEIENQLAKSIEIRRKISSKVMDNVHQAQERQKKAYDSRHNVDQKEFNVGQKVLLKNFRRNRGLGTVNVDKYKGPYEIVKYISKGNYKLKEIKSSKIFGNHNQRNFKAYKEDEIEVIPETSDSDSSDPIPAAQPPSNKLVISETDSSSNELFGISDEENIFFPAPSTSTPLPTSASLPTTTKRPAETVASSNVRLSKRQRKPKESSIYEYDY